MPYIVWNGPAPTTAAFVKVTTGTAIKTMSQLSTPATRQIRVYEWGFSLDVAPGAASVVELIQTDVAATVTAHVASGLVNLDPNGTASLLTLGVSNTGYTATAEGTTTASRLFDVKEIPLAAGASDLTYVKQFMPDARPIVAISKFLRVRATFATSASNMATYVIYDEV
jgi:hypothetical protein